MLIGTLLTCILTLKYTFSYSEETDRYKWELLTIQINRNLVKKEARVRPQVNNATQGNTSEHEGQRVTCLNSGLMSRKKQSEILTEIAKPHKQRW